MNLRQTEKADESASASDEAHNSDWTVLVRVGEESWHIGDPRSTGKTPEETASVKWRKAARNFQRRSKYSVRIGYVLETWARNFWTSGENFLSTYFFGRNDAKVSRSNSSARRFRDSLQLGLLVGLILGCFSLILFHQMVPARASAKASSTHTKAAAATSVAGTVPIGSPALTIPAFRLYTVQLGSYGSAQQAAASQHKLQGEGVWSTVIRMGNQYNVVTGSSMYSSSLKQTEAALKKKTSLSPSIVTLNQPVTRIRASTSLSADKARNIAGWLTSVVSSLNTITAVTENGEPERDAKISYDAAVKLMPATAVLKQAVNTTELVSLKKDWQAAYSALAKKNQLQAQRDGLKAYTDLFRLQNHT